MQNTRPRLLDLCCKAGGTSQGYFDAGFDVTGVDKDPQPRYPYRFIHADALDYLASHGHEYDAIAASWPCQKFTTAQRLRGNTHPDLITPGRDLLNTTGRPWIMENVEGAPLHHPVMLCGAMFPALGVYRHRLFEASFLLTTPPHPAHREPLTKIGRPPSPGERMHVVGNFSGVTAARTAMGITWMTRDELAEAIPPAYTRYLGQQLLAHLNTGVSVHTAAA